MTKTTSLLSVAAAVIMSGTPAAAQTTKNMFLDVNVGLQAASRTFVVSGVQTVYDEAAIFSTDQKIGSGGLFDVSAGYKVWRDLSVGLGFSVAGGSKDGAMTAAVPDPLFNDRRVVTNATADGLGHTEKTLHVQATWTTPVTDKMDASFVFGPSFINVRQELVTGITVAPGTQAATPIIEKQSGTAKGFNIGADLTYLLNPRYGVGGFIRYVGGSVDLPGVSNLKAGGFQLGGGGRLRF